jgi:hypothetical protein
MIKFWMMLLAICSSDALFADEVIRRGEPVEAVYEKLGTPRGTVDLGDKKVLYYHLGSIEIISGVVTAFALMTEEEYAARLEASVQREAQRQQRLKAERANRLANGVDRKRRVLNDPDFVVASGSRKLSFWRQFSATYPEVDIRHELQEAVTQARSENLAQRETQRQRQRIAQLELDVAEKEQRARLAERDARRSRSYNPAYTSRYARYSSGYGSTYPSYYRPASDPAPKQAPRPSGQSSHSHLGRTYNNPQIITIQAYQPSTTRSLSAIQTPAPSSARTIGTPSSR